MSDLGDPVFVVAALAVVAGAFVQGIVGIGFSMLAAPIVAIARPELLPAPMILAGGCTSLIMAAREFRSIDFRRAGIAIAGRVSGAIVAGPVIGILPGATFGIVFGLLVLAAVGLSVSGWRVGATPSSLAAAGFASGLMGTIPSIGAPPMGIVMQNMQPAILRATAGAFFVGGTAASLAVLAWAGRFGGAEIALGLALLVPVALGVALSSLAVRRVNARAVRALVLAISALSALVLIARSV